VSGSALVGQSARRRRRLVSWRWQCGWSSCRRRGGASALGHRHGRRPVQPHGAFREFGSGTAGCGGLRRSSLAGPLRTTSWRTTCSSCGPEISEWRVEMHSFQPGQRRRVVDTFDPPGGLDKQGRCDSVYGHGRYMRRSPGPPGHPRTRCQALQSSARHPSRDGQACFDGVSADRLELGRQAGQMRLRRAVGKRSAAGVLSSPIDPTAIRCRPCDERGSSAKLRGRCKRKICGAYQGLEQRGRGRCHTASAFALRRDDVGRFGHRCRNGVTMKTEVVRNRSRFRGADDIAIPSLSRHVPTSNRCRRT